jgi:hypothetical protein
MQSGGKFNLLGFGPLGMAYALQHQRLRAARTPRSAETAAPGDGSKSRARDDLSERYDE